MRLTFIVLLILFVILITFGIQSAFAFDYFKTMGTMYSTNPVYCIMEPDPELEPRYEYLREISINSLAEWQLKLEGKTSGNWTLYYQSYAFDQHNTRTTEDFRQCSAFINFISEPSKDGVLGSASANLEQDYYWLEIQTQISHRKITINLGESWENRVSNLVIDRTIPMSDIRNTLLHEIGHSLGVEHFYCVPMDEYCIDKSIMFSHISTFKGIIKPVTESDINMVIRIYGDDGFLGYHNPVGNICLVATNGRVC